MERKSLKSISWQVDEPTYRQDPALSQTAIGKYEKGGFESLDTIFDHIETPSLKLGSAVDCYITEGESVFQQRYMISDIPKMEPSVEPIVKEIYSQFNNSYTDINDIPEAQMMPIIASYGYQPKWKPETRVKAIREKGRQYYQTMFMARGKKILLQDTYNKVFACVRALKDSPQTRGYFCEDDPFDDIERYYQLKFKDTFDGVDYRGMLDLVIVDHKNKKVLPCDLKTSSKMEYNFFKSFIEFGYSYQARLYWRLLRKAMDRDDYYRDFKLMPFRFIAVNTVSIPKPLVWEFKEAEALGTITLGDYVLRDPEEIGKELMHYLQDRPEVPDGIKIEGVNSITEWLKNGRRNVIL